VAKDLKVGGCGQFKDIPLFAWGDQYEPQMTVRTVCSPDEIRFE